MNIWIKVQKKTLVTCQTRAYNPKKENLLMNSLRVRISLSNKTFKMEIKAEISYLLLRKQKLKKVN